MTVEAVLPYLTLRCQGSEDSTVRILGSQNSTCRVVSVPDQCGLTNVSPPRAVMRIAQDDSMAEEGGMAAAVASRLVAAERANSGEAQGPRHYRHQSASHRTTLDLLGIC